MLTKINHKLDEVLGLLMDRRKTLPPRVDPIVERSHRVEPNEEHAAQIAHVLKMLSTFEERSISNSIGVMQLLSKMGGKIERLECMSQALLDAVATMTANVQSLTDTVAAHDTEVSTGIAALQAALAASGNTDPDVAAAVTSLAGLSGSVKDAADKINTETQAIAAAIPATPPPAPAPAPAPTADPGANPSTPAGS